MKILEIDGMTYTLEHSGVKFDVIGSYTEDGHFFLHPANGWDDLAVELNQDPESLLEDIDDAIYNATPERYEVNHE